MRPLWRVGLETVGRRRAALVVACSAVVSGLLLVGASIGRLPGYAYEDGGRSWSSEPGLLGVVSDPGTRGGVVFALALACGPLLLLLDQAVRLGSADRRRRVAALRVAGATRGDLGRLGAVEIGVPTAAGAVLGVAVWAVLRQVLGAWLVPYELAVVPVTVGPGPWAVAVVAAVAAYGVLVGARAGRRAAGSAAGEPRGLPRPPRPWGLLPLGGGAALMVALASSAGAAGDDQLTVVALAAMVLGLGLLAPAVAWVAAGGVAGRAQSVPLLLAARRLQLDARPAGRAAAAVGAVAMALASVGAFVPEVLPVDAYDRGYYLVPAGGVAAVALAAAALVAASLALHTSETVLDRRRQLATLVATGVPVEVVARSQRLECLLATVPVAVLGAVLGGAGCAVLADTGAAGWLGAALGTALALAAVAGSVTAATALLRPWVASALGPEALRTE